MKYIIYLALSVISIAQTLDDRYHSTQEIYAYLDSVGNIEELNNWVKIDTIGYSTQENIPILAIKISDNAQSKEDEPRVLFVGQVHAEEVLGVEIVMDLINDLLFPNPNILTHMNILKQYLEIWIIPTLNPEGLNVVHDGLDLSYRKNKRDLSPNGPYPNSNFDFDPSIGNDIDGVDLNRNFNFNWAFGDTFLEPDNSDYASHYDYYKGEEPFSESEAIALRDLALNNDFVFSIVWHSSRSGNLSEKVFTSWKWEETKDSPDLDIMKSIADQFSGLIPTEDGTGTYLPVFSGSRNGKIHDWFYKTTGCFQYLVECGTANLQPDSLLIENTITRSKPAMIYLMDRTIGYYADASQITGIVYDGITNQPIEGANVSVLEHSGSILNPRLTNEFGRFRRILDVGTYTVIIKSDGFLDQEIIVVANNSNITNQDIYLEKAPIYNLTLTTVGEFESTFTVFDAFIENEFNKMPIQLNLGVNIFELPSNDYSIIIPMPNGHIPWEKTFFLDDDYNFNIPILEAENLISQEPWLYELAEGEWVNNNGILQSQSTLLYQNIDSTTQIQSIQTGLINVENMNRIVLVIEHQYETEWDHDYAEIEIIDSNNNQLIKKSWSGSTENEYLKDYFTMLIDTTLYEIRVKLNFKTDGTVNYRGWFVSSLELFAVNDEFLSIQKKNQTKIPFIPMKINSVYPNPSNGFFQVNLTEYPGGEGEMKVFNILGQQIYSEILNMRPGIRNFNINLNNLNGLPTGNGMFFIQIETEQMQAIKKCIIINN
jgi:hypothetical protein